MGSVTLFKANSVVLSMLASISYPLVNFRSVFKRKIFDVLFIIKKCHTKSCSPWKYANRILLTQWILTTCFRLLMVAKTCHKFRTQKQKKEKNFMDDFLKALDLSFCYVRFSPIDVNVSRKSTIAFTICEYSPALLNERTKIFKHQFGSQIHNNHNHIFSFRWAHSKGWCANSDAYTFLLWATTFLMSTLR